MPWSIPCFCKGSKKTFLGSKKLVFCPLHKDDVPSLSINHRKNLWRCFGCGKDGNVIQLVMEMEGIDFMAAVRKLTLYHFPVIFILRHRLTQINTDLSGICVNLRNLRL
ncbi:MAG: hypothetical protein KKD69_07615 [Euryarchaeota archaeon]|nr:hypothetical protein [Euryarchaeota archaeon]